VHPDRILRNSSVRPGDVLVLTKPLGTGALVAASKKGRLSADQFDALVACMTTLNKPGAWLWEAGATAATDITGFGLSGHGLEMARGSGVTLSIRSSALPLLPEAVELCAEGFTCGGTKANASYTGGDIRYAEELAPDIQGLLNDPQTSGGLLFSIPADRVDDALARLSAEGALAAAVVGEATAHAAGAPHVDFLA
jgi:selenide,water dikinase